MRQKQFYRWLSVILCLCFSGTLMAQLSVKGVVQDANQEPIIGVNVVEVGTNNGTITDLDGAFTLTVKQGANLQFSFIGMKTIMQKATANMTVTLTEDTELIDEVIVVGYGATKHKNFTGSVSTFKVSEGGIALTAPSSATDMLRGIAPGLTMTQSGEAGSTASIQIRGQKSINGGSAPLIVVDGVIFKGTMNDIDPDIVESMSVLKDATSLAAYGSQAANGVIMVTTKKGAKGKPMINFRGSISLSESNYKPDIRDGYEYIDLINARTGREAGDVSWMGELEKANYEKGEWTDWYDFVSQTGVRQNYSLNISGGSDNVDYLVGTSYMDNKNFIKGNTFVRETANARVNAKINNYIKASINFNYANMRADGIRPYYSRYYSPWAEPYMEDGVTLRKHILGAKEPTTLNPLWNVEGGVDAESRTQSTTLGGELEVKIPWIKGLSYKLTGNYTRRDMTGKRFYHERYYVEEGDDYTTEVFDKYLEQATGYINQQKNASYVLDNILTYVGEFGDHFVSGTLVYTRDSDLRDIYQIDGLNFKDLGNTTLGFYGLNNAATQNITQMNYTLHNNVGYLGRMNYSYKDTYHLNASVRRDGSSVFGADRKWGTFPAVGLAWTISNEKFWEEIDWISNTKLKVSWGKNGNQSLEPYGTLSQVSMGKSGGYTYYFGDTPHFAQSLATLGNPQLGWETTSSWNFGVETDFLKGRLHFELDAYTAQTTDQIFSRTIPVMGAGISSQSSTMGQVNNWGIEATLRSTNIQTKDFFWTSSLMFTLNRSILKELYGDGKDDITNNLFIDKSLGAIYGYQWIGVVQDDEQGKAYIAVNGGNLGDPMYANLDGSEDGKITPEDRTILGYDKPSFQMSLANTMNYKNWSLYFLLTGTFSGGGYGMAANNNAFVSFENMAWNNTENHPWWTPENRTNDYLGPNADTSKFTGMQSYGFVRLQDINLSYTFKGAWLKKVGVSGLQLYASGSNLFFIAPGWDFSDPEVRNSRASQLARSYTFGMNLRF